MTDHFDRPAHVLLVEVLEEDLLPTHEVAVQLQPHHEQPTVVTCHVHRLVKIKRQELVPGGTSCQLFTLPAFLLGKIQQF